MFANGEIGATDTPVGRSCLVRSSRVSSRPSKNTTIAKEKANSSDGGIVVEVDPGFVLK